MPNNDSIIVGIDVGTHKVCTVVAEAGDGPGNRLNVLGVGAVASEGMSKGMITDIVKASGSVAHSLEAAERQSGCRILSAYVSVTGSHIASQNSRGLVAVSNPTHIVSQDDVARAVEAARALSIPQNREIMHVVPRTYTVDGQEGIRNPVGMSGFRLEVETHIISGATNVRENLIRCVQQADVEVDDLVLAPLAAAEATLTEQEKNLGVVLVDIGHGTTDIAIFADGAVWHTRVIPVGGWHLTNDLVIVFNIPYEAAEALKLQYGQALIPGTVRHQARPPAYVNGNGKSHYAGKVGEQEAHEEDGLPGAQLTTVDDDDLIETQTFEGGTRSISRDELNRVMQARFEQLFTLVGDEIRRCGYDGLLPAGVVLTGGVGCMEGIEPLASHMLRMPVRVGRPKRIGGLADAFDNPSYATSVGLILWGLKQGSAGGSNTITPRPRRGPSGSEARPGVLAKWLKSFLPQG